MLFSDVVFLVSETTSVNSMGDPITIPSKRMVFSNKKSIRQSEFYQAQATGLKPELTFGIHLSEYADEPKLEYNDKTYKIIRTFENGETLELICEGIVNNGDA